VFHFEPNKKEILQAVHKAGKLAPQKPFLRSTFNTTLEEQRATSKISESQEDMMANFSQYKKRKRIVDLDGLPPDVGVCVPGKTAKAPYGQGFVFKSWKNYYEPEKWYLPAYVSELSDEVWTRFKIMWLCDFNEEIADMLFEHVDWQSPDTLFDEWMREGELLRCMSCGHVFFPNGNDSVSPECVICPICGVLYGDE